MRASREKRYRDRPSRKQLTEDALTYSSNIRIHGSYVLWPWILAMVAAGLYANSPSVDIGLITLCIAGIILFVPRKSRIRAVDWSLLLILGFECISVIFSYYGPNGVAGFRSIGIGVLLFWAIRLTLLRNSSIAACFSVVVGFGGTLLALKSLRDFAAETAHLANAGLSNLLAFRARLIAPPPTWTPGEWFTTILLALPFAWAVPTYLWGREKRRPAILFILPPLILTSALIASLSRGVFWSTVLFYCSACVLLVVSQVVSIRLGTLLLTGVFGGLLLIIAFESAAYPSLIEAYAGGHTSQTRSTEGRIGIWSRSFKLVRQHPLLGVGSGNSGLMILPSAVEQDSTGFASMTFSLPVQILVEKGSVGFLLYFAFLALVAREAIQTLRQPSPVSDLAQRGDEQDRLVTKHLALTVDVSAKEATAYRAMLCCFAAGLIAILFRELTYSSLMEHCLTLAMFLVISALVCRPVAVAESECE